MKIHVTIDNESVKKLDRVIASLAREASIPVGRRRKDTKKLSRSSVIESLIKNLEETY